MKKGTQVKNGPATYMRMRLQTSKDCYLQTRTHILCLYMHLSVPAAAHHLGYQAFTNSIDSPADAVGLMANAYCI